MSKNFAVPHFSSVYFTCRKCAHPLEVSWGEVNGLMKPNDLGEEVPAIGDVAYCPGCGAKNWIPHQFRRAS